MPSQMIVAGIFKTDAEAELAKGHLEAEGIPAMIIKDDAGGMYPFLQQTEGVKVLVNKEDASKAVDILEGS